MDIRILLLLCTCIVMALSKHTSHHGGKHNKNKEIAREMLELRKQHANHKKHGGHKKQDLRGESETEDLEALLEKLDSETESLDRREDTEDSDVEERSETEEEEERSTGESDLDKREEESDDLDLLTLLAKRMV